MNSELVNSVIFAMGALSSERAHRDEKVNHVISNVIIPKCLQNKDNELAFCLEWTCKNVYRVLSIEKINKDLAIENWVLEVEIHPFGPELNYSNKICTEYAKMIAAIIESIIKTEKIRVEMDKGVI